MLIAGTSFWMVLLLTPRAWVEDPPTELRQTGEATVRTLEQSDDCLWCEHPVEQVDCDEDEKPDAPIWLHPDSPLPQPETTPCIDEKPADPSA